MAVLAYLMGFRSGTRFALGVGPRPDRGTLSGANFRDDRGGPYTGPGGGAYTGPGSRAYTGPGGGLYFGPGGGAYYHGKTPGIAGGLQEFDISGIRWGWHGASGKIMRC